MNEVLRRVIDHTLDGGNEMSQELEKLQQAFAARTVERQHQLDVSAIWDKRNRGEALTAAEEAAFLVAPPPEPVASFVDQENTEQFSDRWLKESGK